MSASAGPRQDLNTGNIGFAAAMAALRQELDGGRGYETWLADLEFLGIEQGIARLAAPTPVFRDHVIETYLPRLLALWQAGDPALRDIDVVVRPRAARGEAEPPPAGAAAPVQTPPAHDLSILGQTAPLNPDYTFAQFVVGNSNQLAHTAANRLAAADKVIFNPLFIFGRSGVGKTHLMHAIAWAIRERAPHKTVLYLTSENFFQAFVRALRRQDTLAFKDALRGVDVLMIDDVHFISGKNSTQEEFFHTFNALASFNRQLVFSADCSPSELVGIEERIRTRLCSGLSVDVHPADYELRLGILQSRLERIRANYPDLRIAPSVLDYLASAVDSDLRTLSGALNRVVAHAMVARSEISKDMAAAAIDDFVRSSRRRITVDEIQRTTAEYYNVKLADMLSARRDKAIVRPRMVSMYLAKDLTQNSYPFIGKRYGGRDHTTVMNAVKRIRELMAEDPHLDEDVKLLRRMLLDGSARHDRLGRPG